VAAANQNPPMLGQKFPFYKQLDASDCGVTCLRMIARHYGKTYQLDELRDKAHLDREGASLIGIAEAAEQIGFRTLGVKVPFSRLKKDIPLPCIAYWDQKHFVVVYGFDQDRVLVADPAVGHLRMNEREFRKGWDSDITAAEPQGIILALEPTPEFAARDGEKVQRTGVAFLWTYLNQYRGLMLQLLLGVLFGSLIQLVMPFLMQALVDKGVQLRDYNFVWLILLAQGMLFLGQMAVEFLRGWILLHIGTRINISLVSDFLMKMMRLPMAFFDAKMTGDLLQRIYDNERVERFLTSSSLNTLFSLVSLLVFGFVLLFYNPLICAIFVVAALLYLGWIRLFMRRRRTLDYRRFERMAENQSSLIQIVNGMQELKLHNAETQKRWGWERIQARLFRINVQYLATDQFQRAGAVFINEGKNILISFLAARAVIEHDMSLGMMLATQYIIGQMNAPLESLVQFLIAWQEAKISLERLNEIHLRPNEEDSDNPRITLIPERATLQADGVSFRYGGPHDPLVLRNVSVQFPVGNTTAIVGTSGSGKTTLLKLLLGYYPPTVGKIRLGEISLASISTATWRSRCGTVMQDGFIFSETIAQNIALGDETIDRRRLLHATEMADIQSFVESLPLGYNTKIGQDGIGISQGQRQRILIARAIYKNPDYFFFDEATNALDANTERTVMSNLEKVFEGKTVVVVAHRLSTVRNADNIVVIERGEIVEQGTHVELTARRGAYFELVRNQLEMGT
jgi:ATP-binding cassette, subfamily B, bacterial